MKTLAFFVAIQLFFAAVHASVPSRLVDAGNANAMALVCSSVTMIMGYMMARFDYQESRSTQPESRK